MLQGLEVTDHFPLLKEWNSNDQQFKPHTVKNDTSSSSLVDYNWTFYKTTNSSGQTGDLSRVYPPLVQWQLGPAPALGTLKWTMDCFMNEGYQILVGCSFQNTRSCCCSCFHIRVETQDSSKKKSGSCLGEWSGQVLTWNPKYMLGLGSGSDKHVQSTCSSRYPRKILSNTTHVRAEPLWHQKTNGSCVCSVI